MVGGKSNNWKIFIYKKKYETAYRIVSNHALKEGPEYAEAEWMSGWIAFSFLKDPIWQKIILKTFIIMLVIQLVYLEVLIGLEELMKK